ncbi:MAG: proline dehydrogenase family protein [Nanoarchaeota archaeon]|nr:proline dehydrogenase family protein [Nanoarchaeota archaeon]MCG2717451.1 proline dehydrogenase family protein [Nanoarchaeota archaeon]
MVFDNLINSVNRKFFMFLSTNNKIKNYVMESDFCNKVAQRWIAGVNLPEADTVTKGLNLENKLVSLDHLGEMVTENWAAKDSAYEGIGIISHIYNNNLEANLSVKPTQLGMDIGPDICYDNMKMVLDTAKHCDNFVRMDMEGSAYTQKTIDVFKKLRKDYDNVGIVMQSYLYRTGDDIDDLLKIGSNFRLCKGAYREPKNIAFPKKKDVDRNYMELSEKLLLSGQKQAFATHDKVMIDHIKQFAKDKNVSRDNIEFQMLYGIRRNLQQELVDDGWNLRIYVPYGNDWYPYTMRRFAESYHNLLFVLKDVF